MKIMNIIKYYFISCFEEETHFIFMSGKWKVYTFISVTIMVITSKIDVTEYV